MVYSKLFGDYSVSFWVNLDTGPLEECFWKYAAKTDFFLDIIKMRLNSDFVSKERSVDIKQLLKKVSDDNSSTWISFGFPILHLTKVKDEQR